MHIYCSVQPSRTEYSYYFATAGGPWHGRKTRNQNCKLQALVDYSIIGCRKTGDDWSVTRTDVSNYQQHCGLRCLWRYNKNELNVHSFGVLCCTLQLETVEKEDGLRLCNECCQFSECCQEPAKNTAICLPAKQQNLYYVNVAFLSVLVRFDTSGTCFCWSSFRDWFQYILRLRKTVCSFILRLDNAN